MTMIRNKAEERKRRLSTKTLDRAFRKEVEEGLNCSPIESKALLDIVKEILEDSYTHTHSEIKRESSERSIKILLSLLETFCKSLSMFIFGNNEIGEVTYG